MTVQKLTFENFPPTVKDAHYKRARPYPKTKPMIVHKTKTMFVTSARGHRDGLPPTKKTRPALHRRRYSIDAAVVAMGSGWSCPDEEDVSMPEAPADTYVPVDAPHYETDAPAQREQSLLLPDPTRHGFGHISEIPDDDETYLDLETASLTNQEYHFILDLESLESWFRDGILNTALAVLSREYACPSNGIEIANSMTSQILYMAGEFGEAAGLEEYKRQFESAMFIFLPINDGFASDGDASNIAGTHWSFIFINRYKGTAKYFDSMFLHSPSHCRVASVVVRGMELLLSERYHRTRALNCPEQNEHNMCKDDAGACGPFTVYMIEFWVEHIKWFKAYDRESEPDFELWSGFVETFEKSFNSLEVRKGIQGRIAKCKREMDSAKAIEEHDRRALEGEEVEVLEEAAVLEEADEEATEDTKPLLKADDAKDTDPPTATTPPAATNTPSEPTSLVRSDELEKATDAAAIQAGSSNETGSEDDDDSWVFWGAGSESDST
ncbi:hypothetical protein BDV95DRAFT_276384 [Massariosphaeria phaeospora]|uniref:Ubiquitin-like protease family profile domain-containing protein n=1 Tax=Massariosphaeria phaeospora TaxID=100035 RepID=A0A7C8IBQ4_9PLEO|nr:hypothetical protein BDV95DRAFT_276384 [Massariosphaeria phaeospora]